MTDESNRSLSQYERLRLERIERNDARLASLGLLDLTKITRPRPSTPRKRSQPTPVTPSPARSSRRIKRRSSFYQPSFEESTQRAKQSVTLVGCRVAKYFDGVLQLGTIMSYDSEKAWFRCMFDFGNQEEYNEIGVKEARELYHREGIDFDGDEMHKPEISSVERKRAVHRKTSGFRCETPLDTLSTSLSDEQRKYIDDKMTGDFLGKFEDFLTNVDEISYSNRRNVMKQITKLSTGEGIRYDSKTYGWPENCYFMRGQNIGPHDDILKLMEIGQNCEDEWGRDHGNGWLLNHPLKKLFMFQQYCLQK